MSLPNNGYLNAPYGRDTLSEGQRYEDFVCRIINPYGLTAWPWRDQRQQRFGENAQGYEIKLDNRCYSTDPKNKPTGRLSVEVAEKLQGDGFWRKSGILRDDNSWLYIQGNYELTLVFAKNWLRRWLKERVSIIDPVDSQRERQSDDIHEWHTVRKFYLPLKTAVSCAALALDSDGKPLAHDESGQWIIS